LSGNPLENPIDLLHLDQSLGPTVTDQLLPHVYKELRRIAQQQMTQEAPGQTLQPTALVHEAYMRLVGNKPMHWESRGHFFAAAAEAMRRILIERARAKQTTKRTAPGERVSLDNALATLDVLPPDELFALDEALAALKTQHARKEQIVRLKYFAGLTNEEIAQTMNLSLTTIKDDWQFARAWLHREMNRHDRTR
jgi:RNA polymerase sigma factor (TIGR02999 family)